MQRIKFELGEIRHVQLLIKSVNNEPFTIKSAQWELRKGDQVETQGDCFIKDRIIDALITPQTKAVYKLRITYHIADETLIETIEVAVV